MNQYIFVNPVVTVLMVSVVGPLLSHGQGVAEPNEMVELDPFTVESEADPSGYGVTSASTMTRLNTPLIELPQTINIASDRMIKELAAPTLTEAIAFLPNVTARHGGPDMYQIRSIDVFSQFRNGFRFSTGTNLNFPQDTANVARVEVVKGLGSATTGRGDAGGVINVITKKPLERATKSLKLTIDDYGYYKGEADVTGPLNQNGSILYRLIGTYTGGETFLDNEQYKRISVFPSLEFRFNANRTRLLFEGSYQSGRFPSADLFEIQDERQFFVRTPDGDFFRNYPQGGELQVVKVLPFDTPQTTDFVEPDHDIYQLLTSLTHKITEWWSTRQAIVLYKGDVFKEYTRLRGFGNYIFDPQNLSGPPADWTMALRWDTEATDMEFVSYQGDFLFDYDLAGAKNQTLIGYEYTVRDVEEMNLRTQTDGIFTILDNSEFLNLKENDLDPQSVRSHMIRDVAEKSLYIQHSIKLVDDRLHILGGWRYDDVDEDVVDVKNDTSSSLRPEATDKTYRVGGLFKVFPKVALYGVHAEQSDPEQTELRYPDGTFGVPGRDPTELISAARSVKLDELGVKIELFEGRLLASAAYYEMSEGDSLRSVNFRTNPNDELDPLYNWRETVKDPDSTSDGFELEITGAPTDRFSFYLSAALGVDTTLAAVQADQSILIRKRRGHSDTRLNFMGNYQVYEFGEWTYFAQTAFGYTDDVVLNPENRFLQAANLRWDLGIRALKRSEAGLWDAQFRVQNVLDDRITTGTANSGTMPRRFSLSIERHF